MHFDMITKTALSAKAKTAPGELKACAPNRFRLLIGDLTMVSDGRTLWRFSSKTNQVAIENAGADPAYNPLEWLRLHRSDFRRSEAGMEKWNSRDVWHIVFEDPKRDLNVAKFHAWVDTKGLRPIELTLDDGEGNLTSYKVRKIQTAKEFAKDTFVFRPKEGTEIFDQRDFGSGQ